MIGDIVMALRQNSHLFLSVSKANPIPGGGAGIIAAMYLLYHLLKLKGSFF